MVKTRVYDSLKMGFPVDVVKDGKKFFLYDVYIQKKMAMETAERLRLDGQLVRVVPMRRPGGVSLGGTAYGVYSRLKGRRHKGSIGYQQSPYNHLGLRQRSFKPSIKARSGPTWRRAVQAMSSRR